MANKAEIAARAHYDKLLKELGSSGKEGNHGVEYGESKYFDTRVAVSKVRKAEDLIKTYSFPADPLQNVIHQIWQDLMDKGDYQKAERFAKKLGI